MRRLYSTFATGWPGGGLFLLRLAVGVALVMRGWTTLGSGPPVSIAIVTAALAISGLFLVAGLWTPVMGTLVAVLELVGTLPSAGITQVSLLLAAMGAALAMLGPGLWSIDARLFGWRRVEVLKRGATPGDGIGA